MLYVFPQYFSDLSLMTVVIFIDSRAGEDDPLFSSKVVIAYFTATVINVALSDLASAGFALFPYS